MKRPALFILTVVLAVVWASPASAADKALGAALGASAAKLASEGKPEKAKELCYKALANDEEAAEALYELGRIFEKEGRTAAAADFLVRAAQQLGREEANDAAFGSKRVDAERRIRALNPYAIRFASIMTEYAQDLGAIVKKTPDSWTIEDAAQHVQMLRLADIVPPDKMPALGEPPAPVGSKPGPPGGGDVPGPSVLKPSLPPAALSPDVERALKGAGWSTITGTWVKKAENVYEVTNGRLESPKLNGAIQVGIKCLGKGSVKVLVRNSHKAGTGVSPKSSSLYGTGGSSTCTYGTGYGFSIDGTTATVFTPIGASLAGGMGFRPAIDHKAALTDPTGTTRVLVCINDNALDLSVQGKREHKSSYKIDKEGPFVIEVAGTVTLESPQAVGQ